MFVVGSILHSHVHTNICRLWESNSQHACNSEVESQVFLSPVRFFIANWIVGEAFSLCGSIKLRRTCVCLANRVLPTMACRGPVYWLSQGILRYYRSIKLKVARTTPRRGLIECTRCEYVDVLEDVLSVSCFYIIVIYTKMGNVCGRDPPLSNVGSGNLMPLQWPGGEERYPSDVPQPTTRVDLVDKSLYLLPEGLNKIRSVCIVLGDCNHYAGWRYDNTWILIRWHFRTCWNAGQTYVTLCRRQIL